jgi:hypothetical protein
LLDLISFVESDNGLKPAFGRKVPSITTFHKYDSSIPVRDDVIHIVCVSLSPYLTPVLLTYRVSQNTQSGSQWDGLKHYGVRGYNVFYNKYVGTMCMHTSSQLMLTVLSTPGESLPAGEMEIHDPSEIEPARAKLGVHSASLSLYSTPQPNAWCPRLVKPRYLWAWCVP